MATPLWRRRLSRAVIAAILGLVSSGPLLASAQPARRPGRASAARPAAGGKVDVAAARARLLGADAAASATAADQLATVKTQAAHDALLDGLAAGLAPTAAPRAIAGLAVMPAPADVPVLRIYARHRTPAVRAAAFGALAAFPEGKRLLVRALGDRDATVRAAAAGAIARTKAREGTERLFQLLARGDDAGVQALAAMADAEMARAIGEQLGKVPDGALARCLGLILRRPDFGPDEARVEVVRAIAKIAGNDAVSALADYVEATPAKPPRPSRKEAENVVKARLGGGS
jgi:hypothetical protein